jgi:hypothetical protein
MDILKRMAVAGHHVPRGKPIIPVGNMLLSLKLRFIEVSKLFMVLVEIIHKSNSDG